MDFMLREVGNPDDLKAIHVLRLEAWKGVLSDVALAEMNKDPMDNRSRHWAVFVDGAMVAAARLSIHSHRDDIVDAYLFERFNVSFALPVGSLNRSVVHHDFRKHGFARALDDARIQAAKAAGCKSLLSIRVDKKRADEFVALGFEFIGHVVDETEGVFHGLDCYLLKQDLVAADPGAPLG